MSSSYGHFLEIFDRYDRGTFSKGTASADEITPSSYFGGFRMLCGNKNKTLRAKAKTQYSMKRTNYSGMFWNIQEDDKGETTEEKQQQNDQVLKFKGVHTRYILDHTVMEAAIKNIDTLYTRARRKNKKVK